MQSINNTIEYYRAEHNLNHTVLSRIKLIVTSKHLETHIKQQSVLTNKDSVTKMTD